jgi:hypothetical protein
MFVIDLEGAYRQWRVDPLDWPRTAIQHHNFIFYDLAGSFGARFSSKCQMMLVESIIYILDKLGVKCYCYIDDFTSASATLEEATCNYNITLSLLEALGLKVSEGKLIPPAKCIQWLGINFDSEAMLLSITKARVIELKNLCESMSQKVSISKTQLQSILGKLLSMSYVIPQIRIFLNRLLEALRLKVHNNVLMIDQIVRGDLLWLSENVMNLNHSAVIAPPSNFNVKVDVSFTENVISLKNTDGSSISNCSTAHMSKVQATALLFHDFIAKLCINHKDVNVLLQAPNASWLEVFKSGRAKDPWVNVIARYVWFYTTKYNVNVITNVQNM